MKNGVDEAGLAKAIAEFVQTTRMTDGERSERTASRQTAGCTSASKPGPHKRKTTPSPMTFFRGSDVVDDKDPEPDLVTGM